MEKAGHKVQAVIGRRAVQEALQKGSHDLLILGATLTRNDRHHLPYMAKKSHTGIRVLVLHTDGSRHPSVDGFVDTGSDVEHVLEGISAVSSSAGQAQVKKAAVGR
jgi:hypothetical protein